MAAADDDGWPGGDTGFWRDYRNDPERLKRKADEKYGRLEEREAAKRQKLEETSAKRIKALEEEVAQLRERRPWSEAQLEDIRNRGFNNADFIEQLRDPASNDWLLHSGNVTYCRDRSMFTKYRAICNVTATAADGNTTLLVLGVGTVSLQVQRQFGQPRAHEVSFHNTLHIPSAKCNGISIPDLETAGFTLKNGRGDRITCIHTRTNAATFCANKSSFRNRVCLKGEGAGDDAPRHMTADTPISISADVAHMRRLAPLAFS